MNKLIAYKGSDQLKKDFVAEIKKHEEMDMIIQGTYAQGSGKGWKGCAVGCSVHSLNRIKKKRYATDDHSVYEKELGIPVELAYLEDVIFEGLDEETAKGWPLRFAQAINPGSDLSLIVAKLVVWQFEDKKYGLKNIKEIKDDKQGYGFCQEVVDLYKRKIAGDTPAQDEFYQLYLRIGGARAWASAWAGAGAGAWARAGTWARAGAWARAWTGASAWARAWAWARAKEPYWNAMADKLISLLEETKLEEGEKDK